MSENNSYKLVMKEKGYLNMEVEYDLDKIFVITPSGQRHSVSHLLSKIRDASLDLSKILDDLKFRGN